MHPRVYITKVNTHYKYLCRFMMNQNETTLLLILNCRMRMPQGFTLKCLFIFNIFVEASSSAAKRFDKLDYIKRKWKD